MSSAAMILSRCLKLARQAGGWSKVRNLARRVTAAPLIRRLFSRRFGFQAGAADMEGAGEAMAREGRGEGSGRDGATSGTLRSEIGAPSDARAAGEICDPGEDCFPRDLFGAPVAPKRGRGRPRHEPTPELRAIVNRRRAAGDNLPDTAAAIGITVPTLLRHYPTETGTSSDSWRAMQPKEN